MHYYMTSHGKICHSVMKMSFLCYCRSGSSSPPMLQTSLRMPKTSSAGSSAAANTGWARTASRTSSSTRFSPASTGKTFVTVMLHTSQKSAARPTHQTLTWKMTPSKTRYGTVIAKHLGYRPDILPYTMYTCIAALKICAVFLGDNAASFPHHLLWTPSSFCRFYLHQ